MIYIFSVIEEIPIIEDRDGLSQLFKINPYIDPRTGESLLIGSKSFYNVINEFGQTNQLKLEEIFRNMFMINSKYNPFDGSIINDPKIFLKLVTKFGHPSKLPDHLNHIHTEKFLSEIKYYLELRRRFHENPLTDPESKIKNNIKYGDESYLSLCEKYGNPDVEKVAPRYDIEISYEID